MSELRLFLTAVQYFTRVPVPRWVGHSPEQLNQAARYFPAVGLGIGAVAAATYALIAPWGTPFLAIVLGFALTAWLTGAFHEDGLADAADGLGGSATRERALEIMKDSRLGTYGALALGLCLLVKAAALLALPTALVPWTLLAGHAVSRWLAVTVIATQDYVRDDDSSRAKPLSHALSRGGLAVATLFGVAPLGLVGWPAAAGFACAVAARLKLGATFQRRLGGYTGDCLGATQQLCEVALHLGVVLGQGVYTWSLR